MTPSEEYSIPDWRELSVDEPYYNPKTEKYCIPVSTDVSYVDSGAVDLLADDPIKNRVKEQGILNLWKLYNKFSGPAIDPAAWASLPEIVTIGNYYIDSRPCSRLRYLVCVDGASFDNVPSNPPRPLSETPSVPVEEVIRYKLPELKNLLDSVADSFLEIAQNITTTRPGLDFVEESERLRSVYSSVLNLLYKNGFTEQQLANLSVQFDFGPARLDEEPNLENCLMTDEIINVGVKKTKGPGFEEMLIGKFTFLNNAPIKYARTRKNLRNLRSLGKTLDCPDNVGIWGAEFYEDVAATYEHWERHSNSRRGRQIIDGLRERKVWPYNEKTIKTADEVDAAAKVPTDDIKAKVEAENKKEFDFVGSVLMSSKAQKQTLDEIQNAKDAYKKFLDRFDTNYLLRIGARIALDSLGVQDVNQLLFEIAMKGLDADMIWGPKGLVANCIPQFKGELEGLRQDPSDECGDPEAAVKARILELQGGGQISDEALATCIQDVCPPSVRMFGMRAQFEGLLARTTSGLIPYDRDELCPEPSEGDEDWINIDKFHFSLPGMIELTDLSKALFDEFVKALQDTRDELVLGIIRQLIRMLIDNVEKIMCNWTDMKNFGTGLGEIIEEGQLQNAIGEFVSEEVFKNNIQARLKYAISDWGFDPGDYFDAENPQDNRTYDERIRDFVNEVSSCLNPGELRAALRGVELGKNAEIVELAAKNSLPCINPGDAMAILGHAGADINVDIPRDRRPPADSVCDPAHARAIEQNFRDSYRDRADEAVIQDLWEKEVASLKERVGQLLEMLNSQELACSNVPTPDPMENDLNKNMQSLASNAMFSGVVESVDRKMAELVCELQDAPGDDQVLNPVDFDEPVGSPMGWWQVGLRPALREYEVVASRDGGNCGTGPAAVTIQTPSDDVVAPSARWQLLPNCNELPDSLDRSYFQRKARAWAPNPFNDEEVVSYEFDSEFSQEMYDSLADDPRIQFFEFSSRAARPLSSEQYTFSNFLISSVTGDYKLSVADSNIFGNDVATLDVIRKTLYAEILQEVLDQFDLSGLESQEDVVCLMLDSVKQQGSGILDIQDEVRRIGERFSEKVKEAANSEPTLAAPPLQSVSLVSLIKVFIRLEVLEKFITFLPAMAISAEAVQGSEFFYTLVVDDLILELNKYSTVFGTMNLNTSELRRLLCEEVNMSLEEFVKEEIKFLAEKFAEIDSIELHTGGGYFKKLPMKSVPEMAGPPPPFQRAGDRDKASFDYEDSYPWLKETVSGPDFPNYDGNHGDGDRRWSGRTTAGYPVALNTISGYQFFIFQDAGPFVFEKYFEFQPLEGDELEQKIGEAQYDREQAAALRDMRNAFEGRLVNSEVSRQQIENVESFRSFYKRVVLNAFLKHNHVGRALCVGYDIEPDNLDLAEWPYEELNRLNLANLREFEKVFFQTQLHNNKLDVIFIAPGGRQGPGSPTITPDEGLDFPDFWTSFSLDNIFKSLKCGTRITFFHTDIVRSRLDRPVVFGRPRGPLGGDIIDQTTLLGPPNNAVAQNAGFDGLFPDRLRDPEWKDICNIRKSYDISLFQTSNRDDPFKRIFTIPLAEETEEILERQLTIANFYGNLGLTNKHDAQDRGPTNYRTDLEFANDWTPETRGWTNEEICSFNELRRRLVQENDIFKAFFEFAVPVNDLMTIRVSDYISQFGGEEHFREAKKNILLSMYAMQPKPTTANTVLEDPNAAKKWLDQHFS